MTKSVDALTRTVFVRGLIAVLALLATLILLATASAVIAVLRAEDNDDYDN